MSKISKEQVKKAAKLARVEIAAEEESDIYSQISNLVELIDEISKVPTEGIEPVINLTSHITGQTLAMRDDVIDESKNINAQNHQSHMKYGYFKVPKVIE